MTGEWWWCVVWIQEECKIFCYQLKKYEKPTRKKVVWWTVCQINGLNKENVIGANRGIFFRLWKAGIWNSLMSSLSDEKPELTETDGWVTAAIFTLSGFVGYRGTWILDVTNRVSMHVASFSNLVLHQKLNGCDGDDESRSLTCVRNVLITAHWRCSHNFNIVI